MALKGDAFDGHDFIENALDKGAGGVICEKTRKSLEKLPHIVVKDSLKALQLIARGHRRSLNKTKFISLTGSVGKTTCKEILKEMLSFTFSTHATRANLNNEIGVPLTLLETSKDHQFSIVEMGARHPGDIRLLSDIAEADVSCLLNVGESHLGEFGSLEALLKTKLEIFQYGLSDNTVVAFFDQKEVLEGAQKTAKRIVSFGYKSGADVRIKDVTWLSGGKQRIDFQVFGKPHSFELSVCHESYPINCAASLAIACALGVDTEDMKESLKKFSGIKGRYKVYNADNQIIIDDSYNASPQSMRAGFLSMAKAYPQKKKLLVLGDMLELGEKSQNYHEVVGRDCVEIVGPEMIFGVGKDSQHILSAARKMGVSEKNLLHFQTVEDLLRQDIDFSELADLIYVKGSRSIKLDLVIDRLIS